MAEHGWGEFGSLPWFLKNFGVDLMKADTGEIGRRLDERFPRGDPVRRTIVVAAGRSLYGLHTEKAALQLIALFEAELGEDLESENFFLTLRDWCERGLGSSLAGASRAEATRLVGSVIDAWTHAMLLSRDEDGVASDDNAMTAVADRLCRFFTRKPLPASGDKVESLDITRFELVDQFRRLEEAGFDRQQQAHLLSSWLLALNRLDEMPAVKGVAECFVDFVWPGLRGILSLGALDAEDWTPRMADDDQFHSQLQVMTLWVRALTLLEEDDTSLPGVVEVILTEWEARRDRLSPEASFEVDDREYWGPAHWVLEALVVRAQRDAAVWAGMPQRALPHILLVRHLDALSIRMALNLLPRPASSEAAGGTRGNGAPPPTAVPLGATGSDPGQLVFDPLPDEEPEGAKIDVWPFYTSGGSPSARGRHHEPGKALAGDGPAPVTVNRCTPERYRLLTRPLSEVTFGEALPPGAAFLGCYDLPEPGRPVAVLAYHDPTEGVFIELVAGQASRDFGVAAGDGLRQFDGLLMEAWRIFFDGLAGRSEPGRAEALSRFSSEVGRLIDRRYKIINHYYGILVTEAISRVIARGVRPDRLKQADLVVCPRGMVSSAPIELLGEESPLVESFASVTVVPGLCFLGWTRERASMSRPLGPVLRLSVAGWEQRATGPESGEPGMVRHLMEGVRSLLKQRGVGERLEVRVAAERPLASVRRAAAMVGSADWGIVFGHGVLNPFGVRLSDGVFPSGQAHRSGGDVPDDGRKASVLFCCSCFGGRWAQHADRSDAVSPITDEVALSLVLGDSWSGVRRPTCVGGFANQVPGELAADHILELIAERTLLASGGPVGPAEFQFARVARGLVRSRLVDLGLDPRNVRTELFEDIGAQDPHGLLALFTALSFRLVGCEPAVSSPG